MDSTVFQNRMRTLVTEQVEEAVSARLPMLCEAVEKHVFTRRGHPDEDKVRTWLASQPEEGAQAAPPAPPSGDSSSSDSDSGPSEAATRRTQVSRKSRKSKVSHKTGKKSNRRKKDVTSSSTSSSSSSSESDSESYSSSSDTANTAEKKRKKKAKRSKKKKGKKKAKKSRKDRQSDSESSDDTNSRSTRRARRLIKAAEAAETQEKKDGLEVIIPINPIFKNVVDYRTYRLEDRRTTYNGKTATATRRYQKRMDVNIPKEKKFSATKPIAVINFLQRFKKACDSAEAHEGVAMWLFQFYTEDHPNTLISQRVQLPAKSKRSQRAAIAEGKCTSYAATVNLLLRRYASNDILARAYSEVTSFRQPKGTSETTYAHKLQAKADSCGDNVFPGEFLISIFIEGIHSSLQGNVRMHYAANPTSDLFQIAQYALGISEVQSKQSSIDNDSEKKGKKKDRQDKAKTKGQIPTQSAVNTITDDYTETLEALAMETDSTGRRIGPFHTCRFCLDNTHESPKCKWIKAGSGKELVRVREANYQKIQAKRRQAYGGSHPSAGPVSTGYKAPTSDGAAGPSSSQGN